MTTATKIKIILSYIHLLKSVNSNIFTRFDFFMSLPLMNHSSFGLGVEEYFTSIVTSSPFFTLNSLWRMSRFILGAVSITKNKENINFVQCSSGHAEESCCIAMKITILDNKCACERNTETVIIVSDSLDGKQYHLCQELDMRLSICMEVSHYLGYQDNWTALHLAPVNLCVLVWWQSAFRFPCPNGHCISLNI